jgi:uncharacterized protein GlcG (DUF336 family)
VITRKALTLADVQRMAAAVAEAAAAARWSPTLAICDDGGHLWWLQRWDGAAPITVEFAIAKARTAALGHYPTQIFETLINGGRVAMLGLPGAGGAVEGGLPIEVEGCVIGAVGVSGLLDSADDRRLGEVAIAALLAANGCWRAGQCAAWLGGVSIARTQR